MNGRKSNKNEKAFDTTQFIVKKIVITILNFKRRCHFCRWVMVFLGKSTFQQSSFAVAETMKRVKEKRREGGKGLRGVQGFREKQDEREKKVLKRENRESEMRENGETKRQSEF